MTTAATVLAVVGTVGTDLESTSTFLKEPMKDFLQWLAERGKRTGLGIYPPQYAVGQYPPLYFAPISATHQNAFAHIHGDVHKDLLSDPIKKAWEKNKKRKKQRQASSE